jgi:predicted 3-demethylubiquinone-9 3-methyltransferase (glyoxalase superfamily)
MKIPFEIIPCITYNGCAEEAVQYYVSIIPNSKIETIEYYKKGERGEEGKVSRAAFWLMDKPFMAFDMDEPECPVHNWAISFYINCIDEKIFNSIFEKLWNNGIILMGPEAFSIYRKAAWVTDKYGITWQVILE